MKVFVIGGTRFIGPATVQCLLQAGHQVTLFHRGVSSAKFDLPIHETIGDRLDLDILRRAIEECAPDAVLDMCAYFESHQSTFEAATTGSEFRHVLVSSCDVYRNFGGLLGLESGEPDRVPLREDGPLRTRLFPYSDGASAREGFEKYDKIPIEQRVTSLGGTVVRLPMVYGEGDPQHRTAPYLKIMDSGVIDLEIGHKTAEWRSCRAHVANVALALRLCIESGKAGEVYNVADEPSLTEYEWARAISKAAGWDGTIHVVDEATTNESELAVANPHWNIDVDSSKIRSTLGYIEQVGLAEALGRTVAYERQSKAQERVS